MGVLQRFERRLEGLVEGAFAWGFKSEVQPVEVGSAIQREMDERAAIIAQGRTLVPNHFLVELAESDQERLAVYSSSLGEELAKLAREYASEQGYSFVGPVEVHFQGSEDLQTGRFRVHSKVARPGPGNEPRPSSAYRGDPRLLFAARDTHEASPAGQGAQNTFNITSATTLLGRATDCHIRIEDDGVSRRHAEIRVDDNDATLVDLDSTNGTFVNGQQVNRVRLVDGTRITVGHTVMTFRRD